MKEEAILLSNRGLSAEDERITKILALFGVPWRALNVAEFFGQNSAASRESPKPRLMCSSDTFLQLIDVLEHDPNWTRPWREQVHSAFIYSGNDRDALHTLAKTLSGDDLAVIDRIDSGSEDFVISDDLNEICGVMSGLRVTPSRSNPNGNLVLRATGGSLTRLISYGDGAIFWKVQYKGVPVFLLTSQKIIDLDAQLRSQNFDVHDHFANAVPPVLYIRWAFADVCWSAPKTNACLVIDDPVLKRRHGFVDFRELLSLMKQHKFSTNIAFIPWNWRRSTPEVVRLFRENPESYSLSVHGCDHTRAEFGSSDQRHLYWKLQQALERMDAHQSMTGIRHDRVMVFPQGIFSEAAMNALKRTDLIAAVNNDVISAGPHRRAVSLGELWEVAIMGYGFPLFTRRYPWEGIENFAFDALLGKPAIIVIHHDYCSDRCLRLIQFVDRLNSLKDPPTWRSLEEVLTRSYRERQLSSGHVEIEMYAAELRLENRSGEPIRFSIRRRENEPSVIREISDESRPLAWNSANGYISFEVELRSGESKVVRIKSHVRGRDGRDGDDLRYKFGAMLRRYLCEIRDNYVTTAKLRVANRIGSRDYKSEVRAR